MFRTRISTVVLKKWFPPHDPLAAKIARCCILREDMMIEMQGVTEEEIPPLDENSADYRKRYFFRKLLLSELELSGAINRLLSDSDFKELLERQSAGVKVRFSKMARVLATAHPVLKEIRDDICGHVGEKAVQEALDNISFESSGFLEIGRLPKFTHFRFVDELVSAILMAGIPDAERLEPPSTKYRRLRSVLDAFSLIEYCFAMYGQDRGLLPIGTIE